MYTFDMKKRRILFKLSKQTKIMLRGL